jgi:hypothetical protein
LHNVKFAQTDIAQFSSDASFDALVGRYILQFLPDPVGVLRSLFEKIRPGGIIAFQEGSWASFVLLSAHLPLWSASVSLLHESAARSGVNVEMGLGLHKVFRDAGLPAPSMRLEMEVGHDPDFTRWVSDSRLRSWATSTRYSSDCKRKLHLRTPLCLACAGGSLVPQARELGTFFEIYADCAGD